MHQKLRRLGAWIGSLAVLLTTMTSPLAPLAAAAETDPVPETISPATVGPVIINELLPDPLTGNEFVELTNAGTTGPTDISGWSLWDEAGTRYTFPNGTPMDSRSFLVHYFSSSVLNNDKDTITLKDANNVTRDTLSYGNRGTDKIVTTTSAGKTIGRVPDGSTADFAGSSDGPAPHWYSGLAATPGATNGSPAVPARPTGAAVKAGASNAAGIINLASRAAVAVDVTLGSGSLASDTVTAELFDTTSPVPIRKNGTTNGTAGAGTATVTGIDTNVSPSHIDGAIAVRSFVTNSGGLSTAYVTGAAATRDTAPPADPTAASVAAGASNALNVINGSNVTAVSVSVTLPASATSADTVRAELSDGTRTVSATAAAPAGGGTIVLADLRTTSLDARTLADGSITVKATLTDAAGNASATLTGGTAVKDTNAPAAAVDVNSGATVTNTSAVTLTINASDVGTGLADMRVSNNTDFAGAGFEPLASSKTWTLTSGEGLRTVYLQVRDAAGNVSAAAQDTILVETDAEAITQVALATGSQTVRQPPLEATATATSPTTLTFARYRTNPGIGLPVGTTGLGRFYEIGVADPGKVKFPILIRLYYTAADLTAAGITDENQLQGLAYFDQAAQTWKYFSSTGVSAADIAVEGTSYAGFLWANADHLTPIAALADTTPPAAPAQLTATAGDQKVDLTWTAASDAANYLVRYRLSGDPGAAYYQVALSATMTATSVTNLDNGRQYEFGVASRDAAGNASSFTTVYATPTAPTPPPTVVTAIRAAILPPAKAAAPATPTPTQTETAPPTFEPPVPSPIEETGDLNRLLIALAILIIAIGAGTAGYYGYQWWATRPVPTGASGQPTADSRQLTADQEPTAPPPKSESRVANRDQDQSESRESPEPPEPPEPPPTGRW